MTFYTSNKLKFSLKFDENVDHVVAVAAEEVQNEIDQRVFEPNRRRRPLSTVHAALPCTDIYGQELRLPNAARVRHSHDFFRSQIRHPQISKMARHLYYYTKLIVFTAQVKLAQIL